MDRRGFLVAGAAFVAVGVAAVARWFGGADDGIPSSGPTSTASTPTRVGSSVASPSSTIPTFTSTAQQATTTTPPTPTSTTATTLASPEVFTATIICRSAWGASPISGTLATHVVERMTVHHTAARLDDNSTAPAQIRGHQRFHQESGWADLAYHFMVDANGNVYEGRPFDAPGDTFTGYDPTGHFLVCCEGNFDQQELPAAQLNSLVAMLAWGVRQFGVTPDTIASHRDYAATTCPGTALAAVVSDGTVQEMVEALLAAGGVALMKVCDEVGEALVTAIETGHA